MTSSSSTSPRTTTRAGSPDCNRNRKRLSHATNTGPTLMIWSDEQRALGERMIVEEHGKVLCMGYASFNDRCDDTFAPWRERLGPSLPRISANAATRIASICYADSWRPLTHAAFATRRTSSGRDGAVSRRPRTRTDIAPRATRASPTATRDQLSARLAHCPQVASVGGGPTGGKRPGPRLREHQLGFRALRPWGGSLGSLWVERYPAIR